ncbi:NAD(P)-dependent alcohol dehydrogenase [soil metagenome]
MKALFSNGTGLADLAMEEIEEAGDPGPGEALIKPRAFSLNYRDLLIAEGNYGRRPDAPHVAGSDMAGEVIAVGEGVEDLKPGDHVLNAPITSWRSGEFRPSDAQTFLGGGGPARGVFAERVILPAEALVRFSRMTFAEAATLPIAGLTAWAATITHGGLKPGGRVLCLGTGGVSIFAAQIARAMHAQVIITSSSDEKLDRCARILGAEAKTINYRTTPDWHKSVMAMTDREGVDVVVETVGGNSLEKSIQSARHGGTVSLIGLLDGAESAITVPRVLARQTRIIGIYMESVSELRQFVRFVEHSQMRPVIDRHFDFDEYAAAYAHLKSQKHFGKIVMEL